MKLLASVPYSIIGTYKNLLFDMGCASTDVESFHDIETYSVTELSVFISNQVQRLHIDSNGNIGIGPGHAIIKLNISEEQLTFLKLVEPNVRYEVDGDNNI